MIMNEGDIVPSLELSQQKLLAGIERWISKGSAWIIDRLEGHSYMTLPKELQHHNKGRINIKNKDDKCYMCCHA